MYRHRTVRRGSVIFSLLLWASCVWAQTPKYVFLFIGDGMGANQRVLAEKVSLASGRGKLEMNHFPVRGETTTSSADSAVTDSAAAATALACGVKTRNGMLGMTPEAKPVESFVVDAQKAGWRVGILSTATTNHATPAGFYAHVPHRERYDEILLQAAGSGVDFFGGPGFTSEKGEEHVLQTLRRGGYEIVKGAFDPAQPPKLPCANVGIASLADATRSAMTLLENPTGFFIMVEGAAIDWCCHGNDFPGMARETIDMNDAVRVALEFYKKHPDETLIVVTGDHETGGLTIVREEAPEKLLAVRSPAEVEAAVRKIVGEKPSPEVLVARLAEAIGLQTVPDASRKTMQDAYARNDIAVLKTELLRRMNAQAGIAWTTNGHTAAILPTTAIGAGSETFRGRYENTRIAERIRNFIAASVKK